MRFPPSHAQRGWAGGCGPGAAAHGRAPVRVRVRPPPLALNGAKEGMRAGAAMLLMEPPDAPPVLHVGAGVDAAWFPDTASAASPATQATLERVRGRVRLLLHPLVCTAGHPSNVRPAFPPPSASPPIQLYDTNTEW
jgi:hypothetical protein